MKSYFSLNEIESSPFFTASWEPRFLRKLMVIFGSCVSFFIFISVFMVPNYVSFPFSFTGSSYEAVLQNFTRWSQPFLVVFTPSLGRSLSITNEKGATYKVAGTKFDTQTMYKFNDRSSVLKLEIHKNKSKCRGEVRFSYPFVGFASCTIKTLCCIVCFSCVYLCFQFPNLKSFLILYLLVAVYSFFNLPFLHFNAMYSSIVSMVFWFGFISISFLQVRILSSNIPFIFTGLFAIIGLCSLCVVLTSNNSTFLLPSIILLLILIAITIYLFVIGTSILSPFLLSVHFGWMWIIGLSVYLSAILRNLCISFQINFFLDIMNDVFISVFVVFQLIYLIGEPNKAKIPEAPLDQAAHLNRIDHLIESLTDREENGIKRSASFQ